MKPTPLLRLTAAAFALSVFAGDLPAQVGGPKEVPFSMIKVEPTQWKKRTEPLKFGSAEYPLVLETPGFVLAADPKISPQQVAAFAQEEERLWTEISQQLPVFKEGFAGKKMLLFIHTNNEQSTKLRIWASDGNAGTKFAPAAGLAASGIAYLRLRPEARDQIGALELTRVFRLNAYSASDVRRAAWPERLHFVSSSLFDNLTGDLKRVDGANWSMLQIGFAYFKEWRGAGKIETEVQFSGSGKEVEGFRKGKSWFAGVRSVVKNGANPSILKLLTSNASDAHPADLGFAFALMHFIHRDTARLKAFDEHIRKRLAEKTVGTPAEFCTGLGFATPVELDAAWLAWINGTDFR